MQRFIAILILIVAVPFAIYVWPTKYSYDRIKLGESEFPVRIHRVTGAAERLDNAGWQALKPVPIPSVDAFGKPVDLMGRPINSPTPSPNRR